MIDDFPDGVYLVDLAPLRDPDLVPDAIADVLAVNDASELEQRLEGQRLLLVLDNLQHLLEAAAPVVSLARSSQEVALLATSRVPLGVRGERRYRVEPLPLDDAATLFVERAREVNPRFGDGAPVRRICDRLDRLPLALELAAARARGTSAAKLAERLDARLPVRAGRRDAPARQRTLTATIAWSYDLLDESQQDLLARLSVFRGGWTSEAAEEVCRTDSGDLLALSELGRVRGDDDRFSMLETVREVAHDRIVESGELDDLRHRLAEHMLANAEHATQFARTPEERTWIDRLTLELDTSGRRSPTRSRPRTPRSVSLRRRRWSRCGFAGCASAKRSAGSSRCSLSRARSIQPSGPARSRWPAGRRSRWARSLAPSRGSERGWSSPAAPET
jgi:predicted ATPase